MIYINIILVKPESISKYAAYEVQHLKYRSKLPLGKESVLCGRFSLISASHVCQKPSPQFVKLHL